MDSSRIKGIFEKYFEKYKKTEGDRSSYSAVWTSHGSKGSFSINMTRCPEGTTFKVFADSRKLPEIRGWDEFLQKIPELEKEYPDLFDPESFFTEMEEMT